MAHAQNHRLPCRPKGKRRSHDSAAASSVRSGEVEAPDPGPERSYRSGGEEQRPPAVGERSERKVTAMGCMDIHM